MTRRSALVLALFLAAAAPALAQPREGDDKDATIASLQAQIKRLRNQEMHEGSQIRKDIDDWMWFMRLADIATVDYGGRFYDQIDTPLAKESRKETWAFLATYLK